MNSFKNDKIRLPLGTVWLMNSVAEYKGKQELYAKQSPQVLKSLLEIALIQSTESSNRIEGVLGKDKKIQPLGKGQSAKWRRMV